MRKLKNLMLVGLVMMLPIIGSIIAETIAKIITIDSIVIVAYIAIPVLIGLLIKNK